MKKIIFIVLLIGIATLAVMLFGYNKSTKPPLLSPNPKESSKPVQKRIIGFLPFWQMSALEAIHLTPADEIIYFALQATKEGEIAKKDADGNSEGGYALFSGSSFDRLKQLAQKNNAKLAVAVVLQDNAAIETFLADKKAQDRLVENVAATVAANRLSGVNLDFEYAGIPGKETVASYNQFVKTFTQALKKAYPTLTVSIDATPDAIKKSRLYDVATLAQIADYVIIMGYDFYKPGSSIAGPVAPLTGKEVYDYDITTAIADYLTAVPKEKLILGVPYYGWDFPTKDEGKGSFVEKRPDETVALSSYKRNRKFLEEKKANLHFDEQSQTPWMTYRDPDTGGARQIWFEDETSLAKKYDLVNKENLLGVAIWTLGYDGTYPDLANLLTDKFRR